jgi:hypothetical protein
MTRRETGTAGPARPDLPREERVVDKLACCATSKDVPDSVCGDVPLLRDQTRDRRASAVASGLLIGAMWVSDSSR